MINCEEKEPKQLGADETFQHNIDEERSTDDNSSSCDTDGELGDASTTVWQRQRKESSSLIWSM